MSALNAEQRKLHDDLARKLADDGKLVESGFQAMCASTLQPGATPEQLRDLRMAYMCGAQHLFASIVAMMDADSEPTANDMRRMSLIDAELRAFVSDLELRMAPVGGSA